VLSSRDISPFAGEKGIFEAPETIKEKEKRIGKKSFLSPLLLHYFSKPQLPPITFPLSSTLYR
jgi:hypothetical protein